MKKNSRALTKQDTEMGWGGGGGGGGEGRHGRWRWEWAEQRRVEGLVTQSRAVQCAACTGPGPR